MAFHSDLPVTLLGAGPVYPNDIKEILKIAPGLVAADGGAATALEAGRVPDLVIGDFDSLPHSTGESLPKDRLLHVTEQDSTDFEKCLARITAPLILALGFTGARIDHEYELRRGGDLLATAASTIACLDGQGRPCALPGWLTAGAHGDG